MLIVCPSCATSYDVKPASLQPDGRQVRCVRCQTVWHAEPSRADKLLAAAEAIGPGAGVAEVAAEIPIEEPAPQPAYAALGATSDDDRVAPAADEHLGGEQPAEGEPSEASADEFDPAPAAVDIADSGDELNDPVAVDAPPVAPVNPDDGQPPTGVEPNQPAERRDAWHHDIETFAAQYTRRAAKRLPRRWAMSRLQAAILALLIVNSIVVGWRDDFVRLLPQTASFYAMTGLAVNLRGLNFDNVTTTTEQHEGVPILVVQGNIVNDSGKIVDVPRIKLAVRNAAKQEIYSWTAVPPRASLAAGEAVSFRTRLASPPPDSRDVLVRFVNRHDIVAEAR